MNEEINNTIQNTDQDITQNDRAASLKRRSADRKSTRLNSSHVRTSRMPSSA